MDFKLELVFVPVSDVDRAIKFYEKQVGFHLDHDHTVNEQLRFVQLTPHGSGCSIALGRGLNPMEPGQQKGLQLVVKDIHAAREKLMKGGVEVTGVDEMPWGKFFFFKDPDENAWSVQEVPARG